VSAVRLEVLEGTEESNALAAREIRELDELTTLGNVYLTALMRKHLRLSLAASLTFLGVLVLIPLGAYLFPGFTAITVFGVPVPWALLWFGSYPLMLGLGWYYVRRAEQIDDEFSDLMR